MQIQSIQNRIYIIRGMRVMLDRDLAELYATQTLSLIQAAKRNMVRFPKILCFNSQRPNGNNCNPNYCWAKKAIL